MVASEKGASIRDHWRKLDAEARPPTEEKRGVTLCIAGAFKQGGVYGVALCADTQGTDFAKSTDTYKIRKVDGTNIAIMFCDIVSDALELMSLLDPVLKDYAKKAESGEAETEMRVTRLMADIRVVTAKHRAEKIADFVWRRFSLDTQTFYSVADEPMRKEVAALNLGCELIIAHADKTDYLILHVDRDGLPHWMENYHSMGSGAFIARAFLCQEDWKLNMPAMEAVVRITTAKIAAEKDVYVGDNTHILLVFAGKPIQVLSQKGMDYMNSQVARFKFPSEVQSYGEYWETSRFYGDND